MQTRINLGRLKRAKTAQIFCPVSGPAEILADQGVAVTEQQIEEAENRITPGAPFGRPRINLIFFTVILILILSAYCNTFHAPPILDDYHSFIQDGKVYLKDLSFNNIISVSNTKFGWSRMIPMVTFALDHYFGKGNIFYFHLTNFFIHILCAIVGFVLIFSLSHFYNKNYNKILFKFPPMFCAFWVVGLWTLSPVQTNAVTYIVQRMTSIQTFFYVMSICFYFIGRNRSINYSGKFEPLLFYILCIFCATCAFMSKQNSAMLPVMILMTEVWFFRPELIKDCWSKVKKSHWIVWFFLLFAIFIVLYITIHFFDSITSVYDTRHFTMLQRLLTESRIVLWYLSILLWPLPYRLSIEHDIELSTSIVNPPSTLLSLLILFSIIFMIFRYRRRFPLITYGGLWFFLNLLIESSVIGLELIFEHRLYLPSLGFFLAVVFTLIEISVKLFPASSRQDLIKVYWSGFAILFSCFSLMTFQRNEAWKDFLTFNQDVVSKAPRNPRAHANFAVALARAEKYEQAIEEAEVTIKLGRAGYEDYFVASSTIIGSLVGLGTFEEAALRGEDLFVSRPAKYDANAVPNFCLHVAEAYRRAGQLAKAYSWICQGWTFTHYLSDTEYDRKFLKSMALRILSEAKENSVDLNGDGEADPGKVAAGTWLAKELLKYGAKADAEKSLVEALADKKTDDREAESLLASLQKEAQANQLQAKKGGFKEKYLQHPFSRFNLSMAISYFIIEQKMSMPVRAIGEKLLSYASELQPSCPDVLLLMAWYAYEKDNALDALEYAQRALALDYEHYKIHLGLGFFLLKAEKPQDALLAFERALELYPGYPERKKLTGLMDEIGRKIGVENTPTVNSRQQGEDSPGLSNNKS